MRGSLVYNECFIPMCLWTWWRIPVVYVQRWRKWLCVVTWWAERLLGKHQKNAVARQLVWISQDTLRAKEVFSVRTLCHEVHFSGLTRSKAALWRENERLYTSLVWPSLWFGCRTYLEFHANYEFQALSAYNDWNLQTKLFFHVSVL